ncbi:NUDIX domain-containing protein [candidate division WOR-3 bacterium]|uniref:NUDIX domain-containing protein n=1 Tax=candidate division WOR-3 bacterium TaxID=2052148 RepID=A0A9D5QDJ2_UNCW3|nr:NUDIX domain-containing protein [candidate division WOR-3 bacterium]MBD3365111.1 NUDIX domain-containing protein [candidate division WOR-3 bacterium]
MTWSPPKTPYLTVDCIIRYKEGIVLVERRYPPKGWALPGGFVDYGETVEDAVRREMFEETGLKLVNLKQFHVYSDPERDPRLHTVSVVFTADGDGELKGGSDAKVARVFKLDGLPEDICFDHGKIIEDYRTIEAGD